MPEVKDRFDFLFDPCSVALMGASNNPQKWGFRILANLIRGGFEGRIYPLNLSEEETLGLRAYRSLEKLPETPDLVIIVVPPLNVVDALRDCVARGVRAGLVITSGFAEVGGKGEELQRAMVEMARRGEMLLVGPNSNGIMNPSAKLYPAMPPPFSLPGPIAVVAQSGNLAYSIVQSLELKGFGCSKYISSGNEAHLQCEDYLDYLERDPDTRVILLYIEGIKDGRRFMNVARRVNRGKPIVVVKGGATPEGARAALSHTASLAGSDRVFQALCRQTGMVRARDLHELVDTGIALLDQPLPKGRRMGVVTWGGGNGVLAADACSQAGLEVVSLPEKTLSKLDSVLPSWWNRGNPVDLVGGTDREVLFHCMDILLECPFVDGVLLLGIMPAALPVEIINPMGRGLEEWQRSLHEKTPREVGKLFRRFKEFAYSYGKPVVVASDFPFVDLALEGRTASELGRINATCYGSIHRAAMVLSALVHRGEGLSGGDS